MPSLRLALRTLFKSPFVTAVAVVSLALGIGANAAIFSIFDEMLLRPLPVAHPDELINLAAPGPKPGSTSCGQAGECDVVLSYPMYRDLERQQSVLTGLAAHRGFGANIAFHGQTISTEGLLVSGSYFPVLGIQPAAGRLRTGSRRWEATRPSSGRRSSSTATRLPSSAWGRKTLTARRWAASPTSSSRSRCAAWWTRTSRPLRTGRATGCTRSGASSPA
jgi:hypothetical protein